MRKIGLLITFWTALLFFPISSFALGLGEIEVNTYLNQPLQAEIEVVAARQGEVDDLLVSLASREAFRKAGLQRPANLSKLRFKVEKSEDGQSAKILITTKTPVKEPFLNFLVEADWAKGRLLREFTILLDPPSFARQPEPAAPAESVETARQPDDVVQPERQPVTPAPIAEIIPPVPGEEEDTGTTGMPIALADEPEPSEESTPFVSDESFLSGTEEDITVNKGDTLWGIASQFKDDEHSMAQVMLAMQMMNPEAFGDGNINNLKVGAVLRAPDREALDRFGKQEAYAQVLEQNGLWDEYVARRSGVATAGSPMAVEESDEAVAEESEAQLSLLAPGDGDSTSASLQGDANSEDAGQIRKQLALAEEELEASKLENDDLKSRIADLENQIGKFEELQKMVQIEDDSLASLQDSVAQEPAEESTDTMKEDMVAEVEEQPSQVMVEAADEIMQEESAAEADQMVDETMVDGDPAAASETEQPMAEDDQMAESADMQEESGMPALDADSGMETDQPADAAMSDEQMTAEQQDAAPTLPPAPVIVTEPASTGDDGILGMLPPLDSILSDPIMLGGIGAILALLIGLIFVKRKKSSEEESDFLLEETSDSLIDDDATPIHVPTADDAEVKVDEDEDNLLVDTAVLEAEEAEGEVALEEVAVEVEADKELTSETEYDSTAILNADELADQQQAGAEDQDDVLNEVDVYLAYGLYENAEDLLRESLQNSPDRADYRAKLLDTHFATKNRDGFIKEAEALKSLGGAADRYWDRIQIMGFEMDPENELFSAAKDSGLSVADLEYAKPETADFDLGAEEDITDFSSTDFDLGVGEEDFDAVSTQDMIDTNKEITETMTVPPPGGDDTIEATDNIELPNLDDDAQTNLRAEEPAAIDELDLPDEIGDFDIDLGDSAGEDVKADVDVSEGDDDALNFDLPDDLDLGASDDAELVDEDSLIPLDPTLKSENDGVVPPMDGQDDDIEATDNLHIAFDEEEENDASVIDLDDEISQTMAVDIPESAEDDAEPEGTKHIEAALDMDMSDLESADLQTGTFNPAATSDDITEFKPAEITGEFTAYEGDSDEMPPVQELDVSAGVDKTGTFAPGDFNDEEVESVSGDDADVDDISDLMLPDDVDEVSTKLDLAKAFIDMGDAEGARSSLEEVMEEGTVEQKAEATDLIQKIT